MRRSTQRRAFLTIEALENRLAPAVTPVASLDIDNGLLSYEAEGSTAASLTITRIGTSLNKYLFQDPNTEISLTGDAQAAGWVYVDSQHHQVKGPINSVSKIELELSMAADTVTVLNAADPIAMEGGGGMDTLVRAGVSAAWSISGPNAGHVAVLGQYVTFEDVENLTGSAGSDTFHFLPGGSVAGTVNGMAQGTGVDTLSYSGYGSPATINLASAVATGVGLFRGIERVVGSSAVDTLIGPNNAPIGDNAETPIHNVWNINALGTGKLNDNFLFTNIENLTGGFHNDTFKFANGAGVLGTINGAAGNDKLDYSAYVSGVTVDLGLATATGTGGIRSIESMVGGASLADKLVAASFRASPSVPLPLSNTFNVTANNAGTLNDAFTFSSVENLTGGAFADTFKLANGKRVFGVIDGAGGKDTLDYSAFDTAIRVNLALNKATNVSSVQLVENVTGGMGNDVLTGSAASNVLKGGGGRDLLIGKEGADQLFGEAGEDILIGGSIKFDGDEGALTAIMGEWGQTTVSYLARVNHLRNGGGLNGTFVLNSTTIVHDGAADTLSGGANVFGGFGFPSKAGLDWFIKEDADTLTDWVAPEQIN